MISDLEFFINVNNLPSASEKISLPVAQEILEEVANACDVTSIQNLEAMFRFKRWRKHGVTLNCDFKAKVEQECISTLDPVFTDLNESFERRFLPEHSSDYKMPEIIDGEMILDPQADAPDIIISNQLNLWDILIEELILVIDPFPRLDSAPEESIWTDAETKEHLEPTHKPFSDLKTLITEKKSNN